MLEEQKTSNAACQAFQQHRFKGHLCVHCFKPKSEHADSAEAKPSSDGVKITALDNNVNLEQGNAKKATQQKYNIPKVIFRNQNNLQKDARGRNERQPERNTRRRARERTHKETGPPTAKRDPNFKLHVSKQKSLALNIPVESEPLNTVDNKPARTEPKSAGVNGLDSCSESGSININVFASMQIKETNGNIFPSASTVGQVEDGLNGSYTDQFRKALRPVQKFGSPPQHQDTNGIGHDLPEFVKVAKKLRHIQALASPPPVEVHSHNNNHSVVDMEETLPDLPDLSNLNKSNRSMEEQQKLVESKSQLTSHLSHFVFNAQPSLTGHETLPKNIGKSRPSIEPLKKHARQNSNPEIFVPSGKEEIVVNLSKRGREGSADIETENLLVRNSQLSSDVYFGSSPGASPQKQATDNHKQHEAMPHYGHIADCVTIISQSGEVSHHYQRDSPRDGTPEAVRSRTNPYRVVDVTEDQSKKAKSNSDLMRNSKDMMIGSSSRMSQDLDEGLGLAQPEDVSGRAKDTPVRFPRRNMALPDGMYTSSQFNTDSGINDSMESSDSSDGAKQEALSIMGQKRNTPPFPIILHDEQTPEYRKKKRDSGQYKVPIFIMPKGYENTGWKGAKRHSASEVQPQSSEHVDPTIDYLQPKEKASEKEESVSQKDEDVQEGVTNLSESKKVSLSDESLAEVCRPTRTRSITHPVMEEDLLLSPNSRVDQTDAGRTRLKRVAPRPPSMELLEAVVQRERDDRFDSLPQRTPPPPPTNKKDSKQAADRLSSDLSEDFDSISQQQVSDDERTKFESHMGDISPQRPRQLSPGRHRDMSPPRNQHVSRKAAHKKESNFRARLREFSPTGKRDVQAVKKQKAEGKENQPMRRVASPPPPLNVPQPLNLPNTVATQDAPASAAKSKKSKVAFLRRKKKRSNSGSPERQFNPESVEKWLESSLAPTEPNSRNSIDRLEVLLAYKVESTATKPIGNSPSTSTPPGSNRNSLIEAEDEAVARNAANNGSKRRAPMPPATNPDQQGTDSGNDETVVQLQKSYSLSPTSRRKNVNNIEDSQEEHVYENLGVKRAIIAPQKPARRRQRNRTTGFEDMPSRTKRMAPKTPDKPTNSSENIVAVDAPISQSSIRQLIFDGPSLGSSSPLKSALRSTVSEPPKIDSDGKVVPKRPVRIVAPDDDVVDTEAHSTVLRCDYKNLAVIPQADLDSAAHIDAETQVEGGVQQERKPLVDSTTQYSLTGQGSSSLQEAGQRTLLSSVNAVHLQALTQLAKPLPGPRMDWSDLEDSVWKEQLTNQPDPVCRSAGAAFFSIKHPSKTSSPAGLMVCCDPNKASQVLQMAELTKSMQPQPNLLSVTHATRDSVPLEQSLLEQRRAKGTAQATAGPVDTAVVMLDTLPKTNVAQYVAHNAEKHEYLPEVYERDVALLLLQLCQGMCQLQSRHMCLESLKLDHLLLCESSHPGGGQRLLINHLMGAEVVSSATGDGKEVASKLDQKCHEFDIGILVYEFLHQANPFSTRTSLIIADYKPTDLPDIPIKSSLTKGLHTIATKLLAKRPEDRLTCSQAVSLLQCLLWGPPSNMHSDNALATVALNQELERWLVTRQTEMVTNVALLSLLGSMPSQDKSGFGLSDQLQCQYLADANVEGCREASGVLYGSQSNCMLIDSEIEL